MNYTVAPKEAIRNRIRASSRGDRSMGGGLRTLQLLRLGLEAALAHGGRAGLAVEVVLLDDPSLAALHDQWLGDPSVTDVMAFDLGDEGEGPAAEVYAGVDRARELARERGVDWGRELALYLVHGALHLCGHEDHEDGERAAMRAAESGHQIEL